MPKRFSSVVGRSFGDGVRDAIRSTGLTQRRIAGLLDWEEAKVSDLVRGKGGVTEVEVAMLLGLCRVEAEESRRLLALFKETRERGALLFYDGGVPSQLQNLGKQERLADEIVVWSALLVPGLLQIAPYIRAVVQAAPLVKPDDVDAVVAAKLERQAVFHRSREFIFYIHEQALRLPVGGQELMREQVRHVLAMSVRPYITIRVVPTNIGVHGGLGGSFVKLAYDKHEPAVFAETNDPGLIIEDKCSLAGYDAVLARLNREALDEDHSRTLIAGLLPDAPPENVRPA
ncbi:Scr1 family TA system antitoxin-like transcriptional regulator [Lentzea sp. NPDC059081]|uniref:Scr1 family TA system antitoxin-like transcriptional regulator n=1 Tax=Lentzea sp. NPDC059081 TaxID=3346719 RepID=UPI0036872174